MAYPYDPYRVDQTGHGPTGMGNAPTPEEFRRQNMNRFHSTNMAQMWQMNDHATVGAAHAMVRGVKGGDVGSPGEARRALYQSSAGQAALDMAQLGRRMGYLGNGDPVTLAHNYAQGIAGGGFNLSQTGNINGRAVSGNGRVTGMGAITEQVGMNFMRNVNQRLYGDGPQDPSKLNGFNATDASHVVRSLASRGVIGNAATVQYGAPVQTRLAAARENAADPSIRAGLAGIDLGKGDDDAQMARLEKIIKNTGDGKLKKELQGIHTSTDAVGVSEQEAKKIADITKQVTKGMANLKDVYGNLEAPELHQKLEAISGMRITNSEQAKSATAMVSQLRQAAVVSGLDPRQFMDYSQAMQGRLQGQVMQTYGFDETNASQTKKIAAGMHNQAMADSAIQANMQNAAVEKARGMGIEMSDAKTLHEIYADKIKGRDQFAKRNQGYMMLRGGVDQLSGDRKKNAQELLKQYGATSQTTDPTEQARQRYELNSQMENLLGGLYGGDFDAARSSGWGANAMARGFEDPMAILEADRAAMGERRNAIGMGPLAEKLKEMGVKTGARDLFNNVGSTGLTSMLDISRRTRKDADGNNVSIGADEIRKAQLAELKAQAGIGGKEGAAILDDLFGKDGQVKNLEQYETMTGIINSSSHGMMSEFDQGAYMDNQLASIGVNSKRESLRGAGKEGISIKSIFNSLASGNSKGLADAESAALAIEAMGDDKELLKSLGIDADKVASGMDFSEGLNVDNMGDLEKIHGKAIDLTGIVKKADGSSYEDMDELMEATQADTPEGKRARYAALSAMKNKKEFENLNFSGKIDNMSAFDSEELDKSKAAIDKWGKKGAGAMILGDIFGLKDEEGELSSALMENPAEMLKVAEISKAMKNKDGELEIRKGWNMGKKGQRSMANMQKFMGAVDGMEMGGHQLSQLAALDEDGTITDQLQAQYDEIKNSTKDPDNTKFTTFDDAGKEVETTASKQMEKIEATIQKLADAQAANRGAQIVNEMTVTLLKVDETEPRHG